MKAAGFTGDQIGVALRDRTVRRVLLEDTGTQVEEEAATTGALGGGLLGGLTGLLIGIGALVIPGLGPVVAGGVLATAFGVAGGTVVAGVGIGAAAGGVLGALAGLGMPESEARYFETGVPGRWCAGHRRGRGTRAGSDGDPRRHGAMRDPRRGRGPSGADTALGLMVRGQQTRRSSTLMANWYGESLAVE